MAHPRTSAASEPRERSAPAKRRARARVGELEGRSPSMKDGPGLRAILPGDVPDPNDGGAAAAHRPETGERRYVPRPRADFAGGGEVGNAFREGAQRVSV